MKNKLAIALKEAADRYLNWNTKAFKGDAKMISVGQRDHGDLMSIAGMIENNEDSTTIARAMSRLDTAVRDVIPDDVFYAYNQ